MTDLDAQGEPAKEKVPVREGLFEEEPATPVIDNWESLPQDPKIPEHTGVSPLYVSSFTGYAQGRAEFLRGAEMLGLGTKRKPIQPQQFVVADMLNAVKPSGLSLHKLNAICIPRRSSKTTSVWSLALGRISNPEREDYQIAFTAQTQVKARARFLKDVVIPIERKYPDPATSPFAIGRGNGSSYIMWKETGARISILPPSAESFRGDAFDMVILDESQELEPGDVTDELLGAILPTFDTRPGAQLVAIGTAGKHRSGLFWDLLEKGRADSAGIVEYAAPETTPIYDVDLEMELAGSTGDPAVWEAAHPGIGGLTDLETVADNFNTMKPEKFAREYLGIWPHGTANAFISPVKWDLCAVAGALPPIPEHFALAMQAHHEQTSASIVAAWRDEQGHAVILELETRKGVKWMAERAAYYSNKYKTPVVYDKGHGPTSLEAEQFARFTPRPRTDPQLWTQVSNAAALLVKEIETANLRHYNQPGLNAATPLTVKRGTADAKRWALGRRKKEDDITPLEAAALALRAYDEMPVKRALPRMTA